MICEREFIIRVYAVRTMSEMIRRYLNVTGHSRPSAPNYLWWNSL